ncbi:hypothetical protein ACFQ0M_15845 [Kitasatospora aburaviensis]
MLAARARALAAGAAGVPLAEAAYRNLVPGPAGAPDRAAVTAELVVRVAGYDAYPVVHQRRLELLRTAAGWRVEREEGAGGPPRSGTSARSRPRTAGTAWCSAWPAGRTRPSSPRWPTGPSRR